MSISERVAHVLSTLLIVALATTTVGWTVAGRDRDHCTRQQHPCAPEASFDCRCDVSPVSSDAARLPEVARPQATPCLASLMDIVPAAPSTPWRWTDVTSRHLLQHLDLSVLHRTFLI